MIDNELETFEDIYANESISIEEDKKGSYKKKPNCLYLTPKDIKDIKSGDGITSGKDFTFLEWMEDNLCAEFLDGYLIDTPIGEYLIFKKLYEYKGIKVYDLGSSEVFLLENKEGIRYMFYVEDCSCTKGSGNNIFFNGTEYTIYYSIENDKFEEI